MTELEQKLGAEAYAELKQLVRGDPPAWLQYAKGAVKSWTTWFGTVLLLGPELLEHMAPDLTALLGEDDYLRLVRIIGAVVIVLRFKTTNSVKDKGK